MRRFAVAWFSHGCLTALAWVKWLKAKVIKLRMALRMKAERAVKSRLLPGMHDRRVGLAFAESGLAARG